MLAAILLLAATVGLPVVLATTVGDPLHSWPSLTAGQLSDSDVIAILAAVFWVAWFSFVIPATLELAMTIHARITRRPVPDIRIPLLRGQQDLARSLIAAIVLLLPVQSAVGFASPAQAHQGPSIAMTATTWSARAASPSANHSDPRSAQRTHRDDRTYVIPDVGGMRSYWALADRYLGDGARWREIWRLNEGRVHTDGTVMDTPRQLHAGWTVLLPPADEITAGHEHHETSLTQVTVEPGDTLSSIAEARGIDDWHQLWAANIDRVEPGGDRLTDPDRIYPGWTLDLPTSPQVPTARPTAANQPPGNSRTAGRHEHRHERQHHPDPGPTSVPPRHAPGRGPASSSGPQDSTAAVTPAAAPPAGAGEHRQQHNDPGHRLPVVPMGIGLAAAAAVAALDRARRIAQRRRRVGHRHVPPSAPLQQVEADLRRAARVTHPAIAAVELATALTTTAAEPVEITAVTARDDGAIDLHLLSAGAAVPPAPFVAIPTGWRLPAAATGFTFAVNSVDEPVPTLAPVGRIEDGDVLVDLAGHGPVSIGGDPDSIASFLTRLGEALLAAPWSGRVFLTVPATMRDEFGDQEHVTVCEGPPTLPRVVPRGATGAEESGWCTSPIYLYLGWSAADPIDELLQVATDPDTSVYVILIGAHQATTVWTLDADQLSLPGIDEPITVTLPNANAPAASDLIAQTRSAEQVPIGDPRLPNHALDSPPQQATTSRQLNVLGPVELEGIDSPRRTQILNLLTYLALHRRGADHDTLDTVLWKKPVGGKTLRNRMHEARRLVDGAITDGPIWRLTSEVSTDWQRFTALASGTRAEQHQALRLVRGRPFEGLDYADWLDLEGIRSEVEATVVDLAITVAEGELDAGDPDAAYLAARAGLDASRYEERLHRLAIHAAEAAGHTSIVETLKAEMRTAIEDDIEPDGALQPETLDLYDRVRRPRAATENPATI
jgi:hypothetical protein